MEERSNTIQTDLNLSHALIRRIGGGLSPNNTKHHTDHILFSTRALQNEKGKILKLHKIIKTQCLRTCA